ncbi:LamG domain-containing protein [Streptomyces sp. APSN-46.1]|uniref:LamG domain-containing protein n=1 Tax=Streptomyces sp. APSN-46.1 TaxID=2929049 RepID=UPI001FB4B298|nr:LamG domain-containing protein [Streptomyces sp. APSN-46.1]MCJ1678145.1 LamG domain-containing protein [Streptomyces sp. APSN-46.1]
MSYGTPPPSNAQPDPAPESGGGYGYPPGPPGPPLSGYGFPPGPPIGGGGYGYPQPSGPNPYQDPPQAPAAPFAVPVPASPQPDWEALSERAEAQRRRKRRWAWGSAVTVLALLAGGGAYLLVAGPWTKAEAKGGAAEGGKPAASASGSGSGSGSPKPGTSGGTGVKGNSALVAGDPTVIRDLSGGIGLRMGDDASVVPLGARHEVKMRGSSKSYAQASERVVDTTKSFTVSVRVYNLAEKSSRIAVSQGDGESFTFELGGDQVNGKLTWVFRVQTGDKGAASTTRTVASEAAAAKRDRTTLTATYDAGTKTIALYVDGKPAGKPQQVSGIWQGPGPLQLGRARHHNLWSGAWSGSMDRVRVFDAALSAEQVAAYQAGKLDPAVKPSHSWLVS